MDLGTVLGILVLVALAAAWYFATPAEPAENVEARKRYGKFPKTKRVGGLDVDVLELKKDAK